jgi:hypothetical protein
MKKLLGSTLALAILFPAVANADLLKNLQISGELDVNAVDANNVSDLNSKTYDQLGSVQDRLMLHADWDVLDDVHARVSIDKNNRVWGTASESLTAVEGDLTVDEANVKIKQLFGALDTTIGRQYYGDKGDLVIYFGPKDDLYGLPITALDGARFDWAGDKVNATVLGAKLASSALTTAGVANADSANVDLYGVDVHFKPSDNASGSAYFYDRDTVNSMSGVAPANGVLPDDILYLIGLRGKFEAGGAWIKGEFDKNFGQARNGTPGVAGTAASIVGDSNYSGWAAKLDLGVKQDIGSVGTMTGWGNIGVGSGGNVGHTFQSIAGDYRPGDIYGRFFVPNGGGVSQGTPGNNAGNSSLSGLVIAGIGAKVTPAALSKLTAGVSWWNYRYQDVASADAAANGLHAGSVSNGNKFLGNEYDLDLNWQHSENVGLTVGVGTFQPGNFVRAVTAGAGYSPATLAYMDWKLKFGGSN